MYFWRRTFFASCLSCGSQVVPAFSISISTDVRRSRKLVISFIATVGNYEYAFYWSFFQDGAIELEVKATGIVQTGYAAPGEEPKHGTRLGPELYAPHHQHFFCARLDMTVDGERNQVTEVDTVADPTGAGFNLSSLQP